MRAAAQVGRFALAAGALYVAGVFSLFLFVRFQRQLNEVTFFDLLLPSRWNHYTIARGNSLVRAGTRLAESGQFREALVFVRNGLARAPANRDGRILLARLLAGAQRTADARSVLLAGLPLHRDDPLYLHSVAGFLSERQEDDRIIDLARTLLPPNPPASERNHVLALAAARAAWLRGRFDLAEAFLAQVPGTRETVTGRILRAKLAAERGRGDLAVAQLRAAAQIYPHDSEIAFELADALRRVDCNDEARRVALAFQLAHPAAVGPRIFLLHAYHESADGPRVEAEAAALLRDFADDPEALIALANFAVSAGNPALAQRVAAHAASRQLGGEAFGFLVAESLVAAGDFNGALACLDRMVPGQPQWERHYEPLFDSLRAISFFGLGDGESAKLHVANFLAHPAPRADNLLAFANRFVALDAGDLARQILLRAVELDPVNQPALTRLVELDLTLDRVDEIPAHLCRLAAMRRPSTAVLRVAQHKLGSDLFLFSPDREPALAAVRAALEQSHAAEISL